MRWWLGELAALAVVAFGVMALVWATTLVWAQ